MLHWYVIQTYTGREEKLVKMVQRVVPRQFYQGCFVIYHEQLWKRQQENQVHIRRSFPGYVFITSEDPESLFLCLKKVPSMSKLLADGALAETEFTFIPLHQEEAAFLERLMDEDHIIRLSYVATDGKDHITYISGPLEACGDSNVNYRFRKRYASIKLMLSGEEKEVRLGLILNDDIRRELSYGKVEAPVHVPEEYRTPEKPQEPGALFVPGEGVIITEGSLAGLPAIVSRAERQEVKIKVHLFDRDLEMKVPTESLRKI